MKLIMSKSRKLSKARLKLILGTLNLSMFKNWKNTYNWWRFLKQMNKDLSIRRLWAQILPFLIDQGLQNGAL